MKPDFDIFNEDDASVDLTSLIDVLFLLLTFFILAAAFVSPGIEVALSEAKTVSESPVRNERITFSIDENGLLFYEQERITVEDVQSRLHGFEKDASVVFNVDENAPFQSFIQLMDEVKYSGFNNFFINAKPVYKKGDI